MKKLMIMVAMVVGGMTFAQDVTFGAKAGANFANLNGDDVENSDMKVGFYVGGFANIPFAGKFAFQPELLFSVQGNKYEENFLGTNITVKNHFNYLNVPLMVQYEIADSFDVEFGPQVGFLLSAVAKTDDDDGDIEDTSSVDFGLNIGAGYQLKNGLGFNARYNLGLNSVLDTEPSADAKNSVFSVGAFYTF